jgi:hypothetical protein
MNRQIETPEDLIDELFEAWDDLLENLEIHGKHDKDYYQDSKAKYKALVKAAAPYLNNR